MLYSEMIARFRGLISLFLQRLTPPSIFLRILVGNTLIICTGAVFGTLLTRHLTGIAAAEWLVVVFAAAGTLLTVVTNVWILKTSLRPLGMLVEAVQRLEPGSIEAALLNESDPNISQLANTLSDLLLQLEERRRQLSALGERALIAQEEERKRIARSLHDDTAQSLAMLILNLERIQKKMTPDLLPASGQAEVAQLLETTRQLAVSTLAELRSIVQGLRPTILDDLGLLPAIRSYARTLFQNSRVDVHFHAPQPDLQLAPDLAAALYRMAQEALNNVDKHAAASCVTITLLHENGRVSLRVEDDGQGFDVSQSARQALSMQRLGLLGLQERAALVGGVLHLDSAPGKGTRLQVEVPLPA
jgi:two-component system, NarL family, sensor histidine kinase UhpB